MAHIEKRAKRGDSGKGRYRVRYIDPKKGERSQTFDRRVDAERFLATVEGDKVRGTWLDPQRSKLPLAEWADEWMATKIDLRPSSLARLDATVRHHVLPAFGHLPLAELGNAEVRAWVARMRSDGLSACRCARRTSPCTR